MLTIQHLLIGRDSSGHANFLVPFNVHSVQQYIDNSGMARNSTWGTDVEMLCFSRMFNFNMYVFNADSSTWDVFSPVNIERRLSRIYNNYECILISSQFSFLCNCFYKKNVIVLSGSYANTISKQSSVVVHYLHTHV